MFVHHVTTGLDTDQRQMSLIGMGREIVHLWLIGNSCSVGGASDQQDKQINYVEPALAFQVESRLIFGTGRE
jgi:hypothetical protein